MNKFEYAFLCKIDPQLPTELDDFLQECVQYDEKDTRLYAFANDILETVIKRFLLRDFKRKNKNEAYSELLKDYEFREHVKSFGVDLAFVGRLNFLKDSPYDFYSTDLFLKKGELVKGVFNTIIAIYNHKFQQEKEPFVSEEQVELWLSGDKWKADEVRTISASVLKTSDKVDDSALVKKPDLTTITKADSHQEKIKSEPIVSAKPKNENSKQNDSKNGAKKTFKREALIHACQMIVYGIMIDSKIYDIFASRYKTCHRIVKSINSILPNGLIVHIDEKAFCSIKAKDLDYSKDARSKAGNNYDDAIRSFMQWLLSKKIIEKPLKEIVRKSLDDYEIQSKYLSCCKIIARIILQKYDDKFFFYRDGKKIALSNHKKNMRITSFKDIIDKCNNVEKMINKNVHIDFSIGASYSYIKIEKMNLVLYSENYSQVLSKKGSKKISELIWDFYTLMIKKSGYKPGSI